MKTKKNLMKLSLITVAMMSYCTFVSAQGNSSELDTINVNGSYSSEDVKQKKVGETVKTAKELNKQQVQDSRDLVRYETGVTVVEAGRFGSSGYAIRGVDENRVAITVDGLHQAETISSQGFKELFEGYGNFNNTRNSVEIETLKQVSINKGASSVKVGSGALGGAVMFETKDARDLLTDKNWHLSYKKGYNTLDNQHLNSFTAAGRYKWFDAMVIHTTRKGHEIENYDYNSYDNNIQGKTREKADPYQRKQKSTLVKFGFQPTDNHRFSVMLDVYKTSSRGHDFSYTLKPNTIYNTYDELELRHTNDRTERKNHSFSYENFSSNPFYDTLKVTYSNQKVNTSARTDDFCDGNEKCPLQVNPLGMKYNQNNQLVGNDDKLANYINTPQTEKKGSGVKMLLDVEPYDPAIHTSPWKWRRAKWDTVDTTKYIVKSKSCDNESRYINKGDTTPCQTYSDDPDYGYFNIVEKDSIIPAEHRLTISGKEYNLLGEDKDIITDEQRVPTNRELVFSCDAINCDKNTISAFKKDGTTVEIPFEVFEQDGKRYAKTQKQEIDGINIISQTDLPQILVPSKKAFNENIWNQRDLITRTKQLNLDLTKYIELGSTEHNLSYGGLWSESKKAMINTSGISAKDIKWWAIYPASCDQESSNPDRFNALCNSSNTYSFLIPIKATTTAIYFNDNFKVNDYLSFGLGYRYDRIKYKPEYIAGVTPKIPDDMVTNLYINDPVFDPNDLISAANQVLREANANANIEYIAQPKKYSANSYNISATLDPVDWLRIQAQYSKGFRAPSGDEIYFTFKHPDFYVRPNRNLEAEIAKTKELAFTLHNQYGFITASAFHTKYSNFIDLMYLGPKYLKGRSALTRYETWQNVNRSSAKVTGFEISSKFYLGGLWNKLSDFNLSYKFSYQKGKMQAKETVLQAPSSSATGNEALTYSTIGQVDVTVPINALQPKTHVIGFGYNHSSEKFGFDIFVTHVSAKKAKDTYNMFWQAQRAEEVAKYPNESDRSVKDSSIKWRSNSYTMIDLIAYAKPIKNLTLRLGVYNLTNRKYITWDSARSIRPFGTSNLINQDTGEGINRFYAPGRNFKFNMEFVF